MSEYRQGELFVYVNGDRWELGMVKRPNNTGDGYFCWYSRGDTAANTPTDHMHRLNNAGCTGHLSELEARYHKAQAEIWRHRAKQLEAESQDLCSRAEALQDRIGWYRARYHELKEENRSLRARLARYAELEKKLVKDEDVDDYEED